MIIEHAGATPSIDPRAWVAPSATVSGDVTIAAETRVLFGAVITADGGPVEIGPNCVVMENAVLRGVPSFPLRIGESVLVGPRAYLSGCTIADEVFLATGATVFNGARIGYRAEVRVNGTVHLLSDLPPNSVVPMGWVAVGDPVEILPPERHEDIWAIQEPLDFPKTIFGVERSPDMMGEIMQRYTNGLRTHFDDRVVD